MNWIKPWTYLGINFGFWGNGGTNEPILEQKIKRSKIYRCWCGKKYGLPHAFLTHQRMTKHLSSSTNSINNLDKRK